MRAGAKLADDAAQQVQVHGADQVDMAGQQLVKRAVGQVDAAIRVLFRLVPGPGEHLGQIRALAGDLPPRLAGGTRHGFVHRRSPRSAASSALASTSAAISYRRGGSETAICLRARAYSLAVRPAPGPVRPDTRANRASSRPSSTRRSRWKAAVARFVPVALAAWSRDTARSCATM